MPAEQPNRAFFRIANALTLGRLLATPLVVWLLAATHRDESLRPWALAVIIVLQASDMVDGALARSAGARPGEHLNRLGEVLDPVADKLYIDSAYVTLTVVGAIPLWLGGLVVARDASILIGWVSRYLLTGDRLLPNKLGKATDAAQAVGLIALVAGASGWVRDGAYGVVGTATILSGLSYARMALSPLREEPS